MTNPEGKKILFLGLFAVLSFVFALQSFAQIEPSNDHIFPAAIKARPYIDFDSKGFLINGKRTFLVSAGIEYARVPRALWHDRLLRLKRAGFNCIEIYTFWNFHEPVDGQFNFTGDHDLNAFLRLAHQMDLYVIARVGPYYCAEWDLGGYPLWLRFKPGLRVREHNELFEKYTARFFDHLFPIINANQINHGGSVIMVQLENEHILGWGTYMPNEYFHFLRNKALSLGLEVPYFFSGLHHGSDPAEDRQCDDPKRPNPWFTTEFWSVWFSGYSSTEKDALKYERRTWKIIANGGNGYNYYMAYGGSNFGYWNNDEDAASYDYGAAVGQTGDLRPIYYSFKRLAFFVRSFQDLLENSIDDTKDYNSMTTDTTIRLTARKSRDGDIAFLENKSDSDLYANIKIPNADPHNTKVNFRLAPGETVPFIFNYKIAPGILLKSCTGRILGISKDGNVTLLVVYGKPGEKAFLNLGIQSASANSSGNLDIQFNNEDKPQEFKIQSGIQTLRILAVNDIVAERTWLIEKDQNHYVVTGPAYIGGFDPTPGKMTVQTEQSWLDNSNHQIWVYSSTNGFELHPNAKGNVINENAPILSPWQKIDATDKAGMKYDDNTWLASNDPLQMGADGDHSADAWYRTNIQVADAGQYTLQVQGSGRAIVYVDGQKSSVGNIKNGELRLDLNKGDHKLAVFTAHDGRDKLAGYIGYIDEVDAKGLYGKTLLVKGKGSRVELTGWKYLNAKEKEDVRYGPPAFSSAWKDYSIGNDVFDLKEGYAWFTTELPNPPQGVKDLELFFKSVDENATVFINGREVAHHEGWNSPFKIEIEHADTLTKPIRLSVFIENYSNEGGIDQPVQLNFVDPNSKVISGWKMKGGVGNFSDLKNWMALNDTNSNSGPSYYQSSFVYNKNSKSITILRVGTTGLGHGSIWVNGHNLGRYPEKIDISSLYIPECWMKEGKNDLIIYDEDGNNPSKVKIEIEKVASRHMQNFTHRNISSTLQ